MIATLSGCKVICIDTSPLYARLLEDSKQSILANNPDADILVLEGDCFDYLPIPVNHICFSPPYVQVMARTHISEKDISATKRDIDLILSKSTSKSATERAIEMIHGDGKMSREGVITTAEALIGYSEGKGNLGMLSEFLHMQQMERIFAKCLASLPADGTMTLITKDHIEVGKRIHLTRKYMKAAERAGFKIVASFKMEAHGTGFVEIWTKKGIPMVRDEDIWICKK